MGSPQQDAERPAVKFGVLGPISLHIGGSRCDLGPVKQRGIIAALLLDPGRPATVTTLIEEIWGPAPPPTAVKMVHAFISRLRATLSTEAARIETVGRGYRIRAETDELDILHSRGLVRLAHQQRAADPEQAVATLDQAAALWRGTPLADIADLPIAAWAVPALEEERLALLQTRIDILLDIGQHQQVIADLRRMTDEQPLRGHPHNQLMLALYQAGRQSEALEVYTRHRDVLRAETGLDPAADLALLHQQILRQDPALAPSGGDPPHQARIATADLPISGEITGPATRPAVPSARDGSIRWAGRAALTAIVLLVIGGTVAARLDHHRAAGPELEIGRVTANTVVALDTTTNQLVTATTIGHHPGPISIGAGSVWIGSGDDHTVTQVDEASGSVLNTYGLATGPVAVDATDRTVWISNAFNGTLSRILIGSRQLSQPFYPDRTVTGLVAISDAGDDLWVSISDQTLLDLDANSLHVRSTITLPKATRAITTAQGAIWAIGYRAASVYRIERGGHVHPVAVAATPRALTAGLGSIWVATSEPDQLWRIDPQGDVSGSYPLHGSPTAVAASGDSVWIAEGASGSLERIDPTGRRPPETLTIGHPIGGIATTPARVWLTVD